ncbi:MAG: hypothetical protein LBG47_01210 [Prevotellaceae bacterium]|jgi:hypothetical protein|nr:hypothetical protein [Prevotellaceae bacterium]
MKNKTPYLSAILSLLLLVPAQSRGGEGKFGSALSVGAKQNYNNMLVPYEFNGGDYGLLLEWRLPSSASWLSDVRFSMHYAALYAASSATDIKIFNAAQKCLGAKIQYQRMVKIATLLNRRLSLYAGGSVDTGTEYDFFIDASYSSYFLTVDFSLGASLYAEYQLGRSLFSGNFSAPLVTGAFYPHYGTYSPFLSVGDAWRYFVVAPVGKLNRISSYLKAESPIYIRGNFINTFFLGYHFGYEYSTIRDNPVRTVSHTFLLGIVFKILPMM